MIPGFFQGTEMPTAGWWEALWPDPAHVLKTVGVMPGLMAVDLCCGDGWFTLPMARMVRQVVAIDIDGKLLNVARMRLAESEIRNCDFVEGDAYDVPRLVSEPIDYVFMANVFHGVPDRGRLARAVAAVLRPGGRFAIVNWHQRPREETMVLGEPRGPKTELRMTPEETIESVEPSGLRSAGPVEVPPYHYGAIFEKPRA
jgi:ubiquinone/menaquinone biosynthesis C-methylase UbiE